MTRPPAGPDADPATWRRWPLTPRERWLAVAAGFAPVVAALVVLVPVAIAGGHGAVDVAAAVVVYGGLLGSASGVVAVDRLQSRPCPRCGARNGRRTATCRDCGYDLVARPRFRCDEHHDVYVEPGLCACGRRLHRVPPSRGVGPQVRVMLRVGAWLLALLVGVGVVLRVVGS